MTHLLSLLPDLPSAVSAAYTEAGITQLFPWQYECLTTTQALEGANLVYNAPTSGGKTLIAELILILRYHKTRLKALVVLPYISIVLEKTRCLSRIMHKTGIKVRSFCSNRGDSDLSRADVAICTIEKANRLLTRAIDEGKIHEIGLIVVDELHMLNQGLRGSLLESLLTKTLYAQGIQIVGMSATLPNLQDIAKWLRAEYFVSDFRPVALTQFAVQHCTVYHSNWSKVRGLPQGKALRTLVDEVQSCIVFCPTRLQTQKTAAELARGAPDFPGSQGILAALERLESDNSLTSCIAKGVAYHHSGLTDDEKEAIETGFKAGKIHVITATTTLAAGVNLPAQRVIITHINLGGAPLDIGQYRQMCGRAGRTGCDTAGDSYVFVDSESRSRANELMNGTLPAVKSAIDETSLKRLILEIVSTELCQTKVDIEKFLACTLYATTESFSEQADSALSYLIENRMIEETNTRYRPTLLGRGLLASSLSPEEGFAVFLELDYASKRICLLSDLYLIYLSCPVFPCINPNYRLYLSLLVKYKNSAYVRAILSSIGISEDFICRSECIPPGKLSTSQLLSLRAESRESDSYQLFIHTRFYTALILWSVNSGSEDTAGNFRVDRGSLQALQHLASTYLSLIINLCGKLNWWQFEALLCALRDRALYIDQSDLQPLLSIPGVDIEKARILAGAGLQTIGKVAKSPVQFLTKLFQKYCIPNAVSAAVEISNSSRKRFAAVFLASKRKKVI